MADKKISELSSISALDGTELLAYVQDGVTKKGSVNDIENYLIPTNVQVEADLPVDLDDSQFDNVKIIKLSWVGDNGNMTMSLPTASTHTNRAIRFISGSSFTTNTRVYLAPQSGDTLDGSTDYYEINKAYEGIYVWSDGSEWFIIQKKA